MKDKIKVLDYFQINPNTLIIFIVEFIDNIYLIDDKFEYAKDSLIFRLKGIGLENAYESETKTILVELLTENSNIKDYVGKIFSKVSE
ncbi:MAG: hypothetical protein R2798_12195 [Chitinophagales bacterium]|nr:hypothetical protein [Bacteroidota bacterium]MCB9043010.1 hypothetical protein [Chitinophagales bacterium]